jgi:F0F1-type ATP synthase delta subunit
MTKQQLKAHIISKVSEIEEEEFLNALKTILDSRGESSSPYVMSREQKSRVEKGLQHVKEGKVIYNKDLEKEEDEWLKK